MDRIKSSIGQNIFCFKLKVQIVVLTLPANLCGWEFKWVGSIYYRVENYNEMRSGSMVLFIERLDKCY